MHTDAWDALVNLKKFIMEYSGEPIGRVGCVHLINDFMQKAVVPNTPQSSDNEPFFIEVDSNGCPKCGHDRTWIVIGPDGYGGGTSYGNEEDAAELAEMLNDAFKTGQTSRR